jgi:hypothetical protein
LAGAESSAVWKVDDPHGEIPARPRAPIAIRGVSHLAVET